MPFRCVLLADASAGAAPVEVEGVAERIVGRVVELQMPDRDLISPGR